MTPNYSTYVAMPKHANFYQNELSKKIIFKKTINGRPVKISCKTTSISEAKSYVDQYLLEMFSANPKEAIRKKKGILNSSIEDAWNDLISERLARSSKTTGRSYSGSWKYGIGPFWGHLNASDVNPAMVTKYENWYLENHPERSFFNTRKHLIMLFNFLKKSGNIIDAPKLAKLDTVIAKKVRRKVVGRVYTDQEINALIKNAPDESTILAILIFRYMGARKMEVLSSKWEQVDLKKKTFRLWSFKNKKWREIPIPKTVFGNLKMFSEKSETPFLFPALKKADSHTSGQVFDDLWLEAKKASKIANGLIKNGARIHDLRHTFATQTANDNWPPMVACAVLDMSLKEYQRTYCHITENDIKRFMGK